MEGDMRAAEGAVSADGGSAAAPDTMIADFGTLAASLGRLLAAFASAPAFRDSNLTLSEWIALFILEQSNLISNAQLAKRLGVTRQRAQQIVASFVEAELITMRTSPVDSRKNEITVTAKGKAQLASANADLTAFLLTKLESSPALLTQTRRSVGRMVKMLEQADRGPEKAA
jgi:DNA-binding MarR family transcriptional regulator